MIPRLSDIEFPQVPKISRKAAWALAAGLGVVTSIYAGISHVRAGEFGLQETLYTFTSSKTLPPGIKPQIPFLQFTHIYEANTQRIEFNAGSCRFWPRCESTADKNAVTAKVALNYRVLPDAQKLAFHRWEMDGLIWEDGYWLLTGLLNDSANAVLGRGTMAQTFSNPQAFIKALYDDFAFRLIQNNIPVEIESLELQEFDTAWKPVRNVSYQAIQNPAAKSALPQPSQR